MDRIIYFLKIVLYYFCFFSMFASMRLDIMKNVFSGRKIAVPILAMCHYFMIFTWKVFKCHKFVATPQLAPQHISRWIEQARYLRQGWKDENCAQLPVNKLTCLANNFSKTKWEPSIFQDNKQTKSFQFTYFWASIALLCGFTRPYGDG